MNYLSMVMSATWDRHSLIGILVCALGWSPISLAQPLGPGIPDPGLRIYGKLLETPSDVEGETITWTFERVDDDSETFFGTSRMWKNEAGEQLYELDVPFEQVVDAVLQRRSANTLVWSEVPLTYELRASLGELPLRLVPGDSAWSLSSRDRGEVIRVDLLPRDLSNTEDSDGDGFADIWEFVRWRTLRWGADDTPDGDGLTLREIWEGDALAAERAGRSAMRIEVSVEEGAFVMRWQSEIGVRYEVLSGASLTGPFNHLAGPLSMDSDEGEVRVEMDTSPFRFFQVRALD